MRSQQTGDTQGNGQATRSSASSPSPQLSIDQAREEIAYALALEAFLWGYPLYTSLVTAAESLRSGAAGYNALRSSTRAASGITLDARGVFDLSYEPIVLHVPRLEPPRWYLAQLGDMFGEVCANVGGIKGPAPGDYLITGPDFTGSIPGEMTRVSSPTRQGVALVQTFIANERDVDAALEAQRGFQLIPLSSYLSDGLARQPAIQEPAHRLVVAAPEELRYFEVLGHAMQSYLPPSVATGDTLVAALRGIGLTGDGFEWRALDAATRRGLVRAALMGEQLVEQAWRALGPTSDGWHYHLTSGRSGQNFARRAALAKYMHGCPLATEVLQATARTDNTEAPLTGTNRYTLRFAPQQQPPVATMWSLALYEGDMRFSENELGRYAIGSTTDGLTPDDSGALTIVIQHERPTDTANWLPAPAGSFHLMMRLYGPDARLLEGSYRLPAVTRAM